MGGTIVAEARDDESGLIASREAYQGILDLARKRRLDGVIVWRYDRFGRDLGEAATRVRELERLGVAVISATEGADAIMRDLSFVLANEESRRLAARVYPRQLELARAGRLLSRPGFGYRLEIDPDSPDPLRPKRRAVIYEPEAAIFRELYAAPFLAGYSYAEIARRLTVAGMPTYWATVRGRLMNPIYGGTAAWNRVQSSRLQGRKPKPATEHILVPDSRPAILDTETFAAVQREIASRWHTYGRSAHPPYPLTGLLYCACGRRMYSSGLAGKPYSYRCTSKIGPAPCPNSQLPGPRVEWALAELALAPLPEGAFARAVEAAKRATRAPEADGRQRQARAETLKRRASALLDRLLDGTIGDATYREKAAEIEAERALVETPAAVGPTRADLSAVVSMLRAGVPLLGLTVERRRRIFRLAFARIEWQGTGLLAWWSREMVELRGERSHFVPLPRRKAGTYMLWRD